MPLGLYFLDAGEYHRHPVQAYNIIEAYTVIPIGLVRKTQGWTLRFVKVIGQTPDWLTVVMCGNGGTYIGLGVVCPITLTNFT
jgi:hypothetical protein